ncbi:MAG: hypothetical protein AAF800_06190 [Planctomycetota bacterium]
MTVSDAWRRSYGFERWIIEEPSRQDDAAALRGFVAERDVGCPSCDYNLRGLTGNVCPECGVGLRLRVGLAEPRVLGYVMVMVGAALGVGGSGFLLTALIVDGDLERLFRRHPLAGTGSLGIFVGGIGVVLALVKSRGWFYRKPLVFRVLAVVGV